MESIAINQTKVYQSIHKSTTKIKQFNTAIITVNEAANKAGKGFSETFGKIEKAVSGLQGIADPGVKLDTSLNSLSISANVTGKKLKEIEGYARANAKAFGGSAADSVDTYKHIISELGNELAQSPKTLQAIGSNVSTLSKLMDGDAGAATQVLTTAMKQYGVSIKDPIKANQEMANMMNIMAAAANEGTATLPEQKAAMEESGTAAKTAKLQFEEHAAAIQILDKAGKQGSEGGKALSKVLSSLSSGNFREELTKAGVDVNALADTSLGFTDRLKPLKKIMGDSALLTKVFGEENSSAASALINGIDAQETLKTKITGTNTAYEKAQIVMDGAAERNARAKAQIDDFKISISNAAGGFLDYAEVAGSVISNVSKLIPLFQDAGKAIKWLRVQKNKELIATKAKMVWDRIAAGATSVWTGAQWLLNAAFWANPITWIIAGIMALIGVIVWVVSKTEGWGKAWEHTVNAGKLLFKLFGESIKLQFMTVVNGIMIGINRIKKGWYQFKEAMGWGNSEENQAAIKEIDADTEDRKQKLIDQALKVRETSIALIDELKKAKDAVKFKSDTPEESTTDPTTGLAKSPIMDPSSMGLGTPEIPGGSPFGNTGQEGAEILGGNPYGSADQEENEYYNPTHEHLKTNTGIASGNSKRNSITINVKSLIEILNIKGTDFKDSAKQMQDQSTDALLRTLTLATTAGN